MKTKIVALLMVLTMSLCSTSIVSARNIDDSSIMPLWENIVFITAYLDNSGFAEGESQLINNNFLYITLKLEEKNGSRWEDTGNYNVGSGFGDCVVQDYFTLDDGVDYRVKVTVNVYDDSYQLIETASKYSNVVTG